ncbi:hypothetical protein G7046_g2220 [Stylonectria norvegica]|nr:hypothetical protein G7046_g2220 [Stylonectria norvegica]
MSVPQIGDIIKLGELAWQLYNYGCSPELRASDSAQRLLNERRASTAGQPRWHLGSLFEIIGDYRATLTQCHKLLKENDRYCKTTGVLKNITWNVMVQDSVDRLRSQILLHNSRIQHALKPFEIDLLTRIYQDTQDIARQLHAVGTNVNIVRDELRSLICHLAPSLAVELGLPPRGEVNKVILPVEIRELLEAKFNEHPSRETGDNPPIQDIRDSFITNYDQIADHSRPMFSFLMEKMKEAPELRHEAGLSHWPSFVDALEEDLSQQCYHFRQQALLPDLSVRTDTMLALWPAQEIIQPFETIRAPLKLEELLQLPLASSHGYTPTLKLFRHEDTQDCWYRIVVDSGAPGSQHLRSERENENVIDFNITTAVLNPIYALPSGKEEPIEITLEENRNIHKLVFVHIAHVLAFQHALTGFQVVNDYVEGGSDDNSSTASFSITSTSSSPPEHFSTVKIGGGATAIGIGRIHRKPPLKPMLVMFAKHPDTGACSVVALSINEGILQNQPQDAVLVLKQKGDEGTLDVRRLGGGGRKWDILPLAAQRRKESSAFARAEPLCLKRVSILFKHSKAGREFGGWPCNCEQLAGRKFTEGDENACAVKGHTGLLGQVKMFHRRQMNEWHEARSKGQRDNVTTLARHQVSVR